jgi:hypothetical protein
VKLALCSTAKLEMMCIESAKEKEDEQGHWRRVTGASLPKSIFQGSNSRPSG